MVKKQKFLRAGYKQYSKLGMRRKNKQKYRRARGIDSKVRLKIKGHLKNVEIGFRTEKKKRGLIKGKIPVLVYNLADIKSLNEKQIGVLGKIGARKKLEVADYCIKNKIKLSNFVPENFLQKFEEKKKEKAEKEKLIQEKKKEKEKKEKKRDKKEKEEVGVENKEGKEETKDEKEKPKEIKEEIKMDTNQNKKTMEQNNYGRGK